MHDSSISLKNILTFGSVYLFRDHQAAPVTNFGGRSPGEARPGKPGAQPGLSLGSSRAQPGLSPGSARAKLGLNSGLARANRP